MLLCFCSDKKLNVNELANQFADVECRAISLREKRFALANKLRFTQDTLTLRAGTADTIRLKGNLASFNKEKERLLQQSLSLADSIRVQLNDLMQNQLKNQQDKTAFNQSLNNALIARGCINKS